MSLTNDDRQWIKDAIRETASHILSEVGNRFTEVKATLASIDSRLKLQAGLIQSGARALARFSEHAENSEARWLDLEKRGQAIERKLESRNGGGAAE